MYMRIAETGKKSDVNCCKLHFNAFSSVLECAVGCHDRHGRPLHLCSSRNTDLAHVHLPLLLHLLLCCHGPPVGPGRAHGQKACPTSVPE
jgi:hypothetical protein